MVQHNVDFIGGDFNMSAFSTAGDVFADPELAALGNSLLWGLCRLDDSCREDTGFIIMRQRPYEWRVGADGCYKFDNAELGFGPSDQTAHFPVYLHLRTTNLPGPDSIMRSAQAQQRRMERAAGQYERKRLRKHLALQSTSHPLSSQYCPHEKTSCAHFPRQPPGHMLERPTFFLFWYVPTRPASASESRATFGFIVSPDSSDILLPVCVCVCVCVSDQFMAYTGNTDLAILLNKDTFEPDPIVLTFKVDSTSKGTWSMVLLIVRGLLKRPSLSGSPTVTFCWVHIHNVVAKKRDTSTDLLQRLHGYMREHNVDFIGGDFNMSAFSTVGNVFTDEEFSAPGN